MLRSVRWLILALIVANRLAICFFALIAISVISDTPYVTERIARAALPDDIQRLTQLVAIILFIGILTGLAVDQIFRPMLRIVDTVATGHPFAAINGPRLRTIAWCLLAVQLLDCCFALAVRSINQTLRHAAFGWGPSATGWIAIFLLFVLARVFTQGAAMQADLEGVV